MNNFETLRFKKYLHYHTSIVIKHPYDVDTMFIHNAWVTRGIRTSCKHKRELYLLCKNSNDHLLKNYYKLYCKILLNVIREAKKHYYSK